MSTRAIWKDVVRSLVDMWNLTRTSYEPRLCPRYYPKRLERIRLGTETFQAHQIALCDAMNYPIIIEDEEYISLNETLHMAACVSAPDYGVTCHGDPQPTNVIVDD